MAIYRFAEPTNVINYVMMEYLNDNQFFVGFGKTAPWNEAWGLGVSDDNPPYPSSSISTIPDPFLFKRCTVVNPVIKSSCESSGITFNDCNTFEEQGSSWIEINYDDVDLIRSLPFKIRNYVVRVDLSDLEFIPDSFRALGLFLNPTVAQGVSPNLITYLPNQLSDYGTLKLVSFFTPILNNGQFTQFSLIDSI